MHKSILIDSWVFNHVLNYSLSPFCWYYTYSRVFYHTHSLSGLVGSGIGHHSHPIFWVLLLWHLSLPLLGLSLAHSAASQLAKLGDMVVGRVVSGNVNTTYSNIWPVATQPTVPIFVLQHLCLSGLHTESINHLTTTIITPPLDWPLLDVLMLHIHMKLFVLFQQRNNIIIYNKTFGLLYFIVQANNITLK